MGLIYLLAGSLVVIVAATIIFQWRMGRHSGVSRQEFIATFVKLGIPPEIPASVYDYYTSSVISKNFSIAPADTYEAVLHENHEDIDDDARYLVQKLGMRLPIEPVLRGWEKPIETLRDMVLWLEWVRQKQ